MALMNRGHCVTAARANYSIFWVITRRFLSVSFANAAPRNLLRKKRPCFVLSASMGFTLVESRTIDLSSSKASSLYQSAEQWGQYLNLLSVHVCRCRHARPNADGRRFHAAALTKYESGHKIVRENNNLWSKAQTAAVKPAKRVFPVEDNSITVLLSKVTQI